jgi:hypothetical protein
MGIIRRHKGFAQQKEELVQAIRAFWARFQQHAPEFFAVLDQHPTSPDDVDEKFFEQITPWLENISEGFFFLAGMSDEHTAELILTAEGDVQNFALIEEVVAAAPALDNWKFTALKPAIDIVDTTGIKMQGERFGGDNISFYPEEDPDFPEEINIVIVHADLNEENRHLICTGCNIFLDNYLGERYFATAIDNLRIVGKAEATQEPLPINKLCDFLRSQQARLAANTTNISIMDADDIDLENCRHSLLNICTDGDDGAKILVALVNDTLLGLNAGALYPWVAVFTLSYESDYDLGMPDKKTQKLLAKAEADILAELPPNSGCLNIARATGDGECVFFFACKDFHHIGKVFHYAKRKYVAAFELDCELYKDRYWRTFQHFAHDEEEEESV